MSYWRAAGRLRQARASRSRGSRKRRRRYHVYRALDAAVLARHGLTVDEGRSWTRSAEGAGRRARWRSRRSPSSRPSRSMRSSSSTRPGGLRRQSLLVPAANGEPRGRARRARRVNPAGRRARRGAAAAAALIRALGGDGAVTLTFTPDRERDADHYVVYRAASAAAGPTRARWRWSGPCRTIRRRGRSAFTDDGTSSPPPKRVDHRYRVTAVDTAGNESAPSRAVVARCFPPPRPRPCPSARAPTAARAYGDWSGAAAGSHRAGAEPGRGRGRTGRRCRPGCPPGCPASRTPGSRRPPPTATA